MKKRLPSETLTAWAAASTMQFVRIVRSGRDMNATVEKQSLTAFHSAQTLLTDAVVALALPDGRMLCEELEPLSFVALPDVQTPSKRGFQTPIADRIEEFHKQVPTYLEEARRAASPQELCEVVDLENLLKDEEETYRYLQRAVSLYRADRSDTNLGYVRRAVSHLFTDGIDWVVSIPCPAHPMKDADRLARRVRPGYRERCEAAAKLKQACGNLEQAIAACSGTQAARRLTAALGIMECELELDSTLPSSDALAQKRGTRGRPSTNQARYDVIAELVAVGRPQPPSPSEIAEIMTTRYLTPMTPAQVSTDLANMEKAAAANGRKRPPRATQSR